MNELFGVLLDTTSIQKYVFSSNQLKENLGASYLLKSVYEDVLSEAAKSVTIAKVGYIGGGNALLFFKGREEARVFVKQWTLILLVKTPGLTTAVAISDDGIPESDLDDEKKFKEFKDKLFHKLVLNKNRKQPRVTLPSHGITSECVSTGLSAEVWWGSEKDEEDRKYYSCVAFAKMSASDEANREFKKIYKKDFALDFDELGGSNDKDSHIAIVHIDGNGMGDRFSECSTLKGTKELSKAVEQATVKSLKKLIEVIESRIAKKDLPIEPCNRFPLRPIIVGGDDITFVCDGRVGLYFAKIFVEEFQRHQMPDDEGLSACAGVAITKLKYPFSRGYALAEQLCKSAKAKRREENDNGSWIDFHISYGGISEDIDSLRKREYETLHGNLLLRPYKIQDTSINSFDEAIARVSKLRENEFPNSKLKELREVLYQSDDQRKSFSTILKSTEYSLPDDSAGRFSINFFAGVNGKDKTPYFDMIELMELYPNIKEEDNGNEKV